MAEIAVLPGVERRDLGEPVPSEQVLQAAMLNGVTDVIVVGRKRDGSMYFAAEEPNADLVVGKLMRAVNVLVASEVEHL